MTLIRLLHQVNCFNPSFVRTNSKKCTVSYVEARFSNSLPASSSCIFINFINKNRHPIFLKMKSYEYQLLQFLFNGNGYRMCNTNLLFLHPFLSNNNCNIKMTKKCTLFSRVTRISLLSWILFRNMNVQRHFQEYFSYILILITDLPYFLDKLYHIKLLSSTPHHEFKQNLQFSVVSDTNIILCPDTIRSRIQLPLKTEKYTKYIHKWKNDKTKRFVLLICKVYNNNERHAK